MNDIVTNKIQSIQRCVARAREEYAADPDGFDINYTRQDAAILNILRACEQAIDLANHLIKVYKMGIPTASAESFSLLQQHGVIEPAMVDKLRSMVHFRNLVVHQYQRVELAIVRAIIEEGLADLIGFGDQVLAFTTQRGQR